MLDIKELCTFLIKAKRSTYAAGDLATKINETDKSTTLIFEEGDWKYHDNYFGGEPFGGREVAFYKNSPVYIMTYYGFVDESVEDIKTVYKVLMNALKLIPGNKPFRGPEKYEEDGLIYTNTFVGEVQNFSGEEMITQNGKQIYKALYSGGLVDQKREM